MPFPDSTMPWPTPVESNPFLFPREVTAGDSISFTVRDGDHRASDGWALAYSLRGANLTKIDLTASASGDDFALSVSAAGSSSWDVGEYSVQGYLTNGSDRIQVYSGFCTVNQNLAAASAGVDTRSRAHRILDVIEACIEGRAGDDILDSQIDLTRFRRMDHSQLQVAHSYWSAKVRSEEAKARVRAGFGSGRIILTRFTRP